VKPCYTLTPARGLCFGVTRRSSPSGVPDWPCIQSRPFPLRASTPTRAGVVAHSFRAASQTTPTRERTGSQDHCRGYPLSGEVIGAWFQPNNRRHCDPCGLLQTSTPGGSRNQECSRLVFPSGASTSELIPTIDHTVRSGKLPSGPSIR
jgi:hypothetical protein